MEQATANDLPSRRVRVIALALAAMAGICYASFPIAVFLHSHFAWHGEVSMLGEAGQPYAWLFNTLDVVSGCLLACLTTLLYTTQRKRLSKNWRFALITLLLSGIGAACAALLPLPASFVFPVSVYAFEHISFTVFEHGFASFINTCAFIISTLFWMRIIVQNNIPRIIRFLLAGVILLIVSFGPVASFIWPATGAITQRVFIALFAAWLVVFTHDALYKTA